LNLRFATIAPAAEQRVRELAVAAYPNEGCGVLLGRRDGTRMVIVDVTSARNMWTERSADRYDLDPVDFMKADRDARSRGLDVAGIWHSHPDHPARPSQFDTDRAWRDYVYIICRPGSSTHLRSRKKASRSRRSHWTSRRSPAELDEPGRRHSPAP
jgi:proteasome lid subunit RPN8/RPN11